MRDDSNYLDALKEVSAQSKGSIAISSVPLGIVLVQLKYLSSVDSMWLQVVATLAVLSLFLSTVVAWLLAVLVQATYAMELFKRDGKQSEKGRDYMAWVLSMAKDPNAYTEQWVVNVSRVLVWPFWCFAGFGYLMLVLLVISLIWSSP